MRFRSASAAPPSRVEPVDSRLPAKRTLISAQPASLETPAWYSFTFWAAFDRTFTESRAWIWSTGSKECTFAFGLARAAIIEK